jgi:PEGA domain
MTKIESRALDLEELPPWDDADEQAPEATQSSGERELAAYTLDSEQRTLVGIGPLERARRSRAAAAAAAAASMSASPALPPSEPPGPFIVDDDEELPPSFRGRKLGKRTLLVAAALLVPLAGVGLVRGLSSPEAPPSAPPRAAAAQPLPSPKLTEPPPPSEGAESQPPAAPPGAREAADDASAAERGKERARSTPAAERAPSDPSPPPVKLAELPPTPTLVDRASGSANAGTINVTSTPPASVVLDGRPVGKSPRSVRVPAGAHTVVFIHPLYGRRTVSVNVRPGATAGAATEF